MALASVHDRRQSGRSSGVARAQGGEERIFEAELLRLRAQARAAAGELALARSDLDDAVQVAREQQALLWELRALSAHVRLFGADVGGGSVVERLRTLVAAFAAGEATVDLNEAHEVLNAADA